MNRKLLPYFVLFLSVYCPSFLVQAQQGITVTEEQYLKKEAQFLVTYYEQLCNLIGDIKTPPSERDYLIEQSYGQLFVNDQVFVEDDLIQDRDKQRNVKIKEYLRNINLFFYQSGVSFAYENIQLSDIYVGDYLFIVASFTKVIKGKATQTGKYINTRIARQIEIKLTKKEKYWETKIINERFATSEESYTKAPITQDTEGAAFQVPTFSKLQALTIELDQKQKEVRSYEVNMVEYTKSMVEKAISAIDDADAKTAIKDEEIRNLKADMRELKGELKGIAPELSEKEEELQKRHEIIEEQHLKLDVREKTISEITIQAVQKEQLLKQQIAKLEAEKAAMKQEFRDKNLFIEHSSKVKKMWLKFNQQLRGDD